MKTFLSTLLLSIILAFSSMTVKSAELSKTFENGAVITLTDAKCELAVVKEALPAKTFARLKAGVAVYKDLTVNFCWLLEKNEIHILDEDLDGPPPIPVTDFKPSEQAIKKERNTI